MGLRPWERTGRSEPLLNRSLALVHFDLQQPSGLGLTGMADRLDTIGGTLSVHSDPQPGTLLSKKIPLTTEPYHG